MTRKIKMRKN